ncbi:hypothetical protein NC652_011405 [Populus alba x Populus x berolinensis]|uniref:Uncharacterized protein n=1 Tax=Populus alba x Populus x berolinensis TaxID=444605 RepID=A0AAD6R2B3_9ROSI|nr:hypothetical protein NC652_011405 [Populus alba x Populus x berolinensis]KAJ7001039.1 hypothetical protein NC653_011469 [Populus alba x Populus x berolinensis]
MSKTSLPFSLCRVLHFSSHSTNLASHHNCGKRELIFLQQGFFS